MGKRGFLSHFFFFYSLRAHKSMNSIPFNVLYMRDKESFTTVKHFFFFLSMAYTVLWVSSLKSYIAIAKVPLAGKSWECSFRFLLMKTFIQVSKRVQRKRDKWCFSVVYCTLEANPKNKTVILTLHFMFNLAKEILNVNSQKVSCFYSFSVIIRCLKFRIF